MLKRIAARFIPRRSRASLEDEIDRLRLQIEVKDVELEQSEKFRLDRDAKHTADLIALKRSFNSVRRHYASRLLARGKTIADLRAAVAGRDADNEERNRRLKQQAEGYTQVIANKDACICRQQTTIEELTFQRDMAENNVKILEAELASLRADAAAFATRIARNAE